MSVAPLRAGIVGCGCSRADLKNQLVVKGAQRPTTTATNKKFRATLAARRRGSTLVVVLLFLLLVTGVVVALLSTVTVERRAVFSHLERYRAEQFSTLGVEQTLALLAGETGSPITSFWQDGTPQKVFRHFATRPGALVVPEAPTSTTQDALTQSRLTRVLALSSGAPVMTSHEKAVFNPANLNIRTFASGTTPSWLLTNHDGLGGVAPVMAVRWIYIRQNMNGKAETPSAWTEEEDRDEEPELDPDRPIVGRYAYWVDDESSKINYNTAWKRDPGPNASVHSNPSRLSHPSCVNMMALPFPSGELAKESTVDALFRWRDRSPNRPFNSFADARQADASLLQILEHNKFELTHYNHDPDTNLFGEGRILLTTRRSLVPQVNGVPARDFIDILRDDVAEASLDPGLRDDIAGGQADWRAAANGSVVLPNKFDGAVRKLVYYLTARNWPMAPGRSFADRYYPGVDAADPRVAQLAVNIIEYVRAKESRQVVVAPLHYGLDSEGRYTLHADQAYGPQSCQGVSRAPYITEMGLFVSPDPVIMPEGASTTPPDWPKMDDDEARPKPLYPCEFKVELHLPQGYQVVDIGGMAGINLVPVRTQPFPAGAARAWFIALDETFATPRTYYLQSPTTQAILSLKAQASHALPIVSGEVVGTSGTTLSPGGYVTVTKKLYREESPGEASQVAFRAALYQGTSGSQGLLSDPEIRWPCFNRAPHRGPVLAALSATQMQSVEVDDPRANVGVGDWQPNKQGGNSFGAINSTSSLGTSPAPVNVGTPPQDTDKNGNLTDYSTRMPPPLGAGTNNDRGDNGQVTSIGELGCVATGPDAAGISIPWRTLRLQPYGMDGPLEVPDWALLDVFSVVSSSTDKVKEPAAIYLPHQSSQGGRVNVNSRIDFFLGLERTSALRAAFTGVKALAKKEDAGEVASNIYHHVLAAGPKGGRRYGLPENPSPQDLANDVYDTPAEICEIKGVADAGERSEDLVRDVIGLLTSKGGVFTVYTVGQALTQTRSGSLTVTAEQRRQVTIERVVDLHGTSTPDDDTVRFRTVYSRELNP